MKGLREFLELLAQDEKLMSEVEKIQDDSKKVVEIAKEHGYSFTEDEYMDAKMDAVSGGAGFGDVLGSLFQKGKEYLAMKENTSEDNDFKYTRGKTGIFAQSKKDGSVWWQQNGGQWTEV